MTSTQTAAIVLYCIAAVVAVWGPGIGTIRLIIKNKAAKDPRVGTWDDPALDPDQLREAAFRDAVWGIVEFSFVALGIVFASIASIILAVAG